MIICINVFLFISLSLNPVDMIILIEVTRLKIPLHGVHLFIRDIHVLVEVALYWHFLLFGVLPNSCNNKTQ